MAMTQNEIMEVAKMVVAMMNGTQNTAVEEVKSVSKSKVKSNKSVKSVPANDFDALMESAHTRSNVSEVYVWDDDKLTLSLNGYCGRYRMVSSECAKLGAVMSEDKRSWKFASKNMYMQYKAWLPKDIAAYKASKKQSKKSDR